MAASKIIPNGVQVRLLWAHQGALAVNVLNAQAGAGVIVNQALANSVGSAIKSAFSTNLGAHYNSSTGLIRVGLRDMRAENMAEFLDTGAASLGTAVTDSTPLATAMCLTLRTAKSGKSFRGRVYLPGMVETDNTLAGQILTAAATAAVAFIQAIQAALTAAQLTLAVASRASELITLVRNIFHSDGTQTSKTLSTTVAKAAQLTPVTSVESRTSQWESQRRRANGRGVPPSLFGSVASATF